MKSRLLAGLAAVVLALVGVFLVFSYAQNSDARAMAGMEPVGVLVVQKAVPAGAKAEGLKESVAVEQLPTSAVSDSALKDLKGAAGKVTAVDLVPGEQLLSERLVDPREAQTANSVEVPKGLQEVSFQLEPQRVVGGSLAPGDHVGVLISFDAGALPDEPDAPTTQFVFHRILITKVQGAPTPVPDAPEQDGEPLPEGSLMITVAVDDVDAAEIVFASEFGTIWLTKESKDASQSDSAIVNKTEVYK